MLSSSSALVRSSGVIVVAGSGPGGHPALLQLLPNGTIDTSFADGGLATDPAIAGSLQGAALGLDGGVVGAGYSLRQPPGLIDFLASGAPENPTVSADYPCGSFGDVARADDGYRAAVGSGFRQCFFLPVSPIVMLLAPDAAPDPGFGAGGIIEPGNGASAASGVAFDAQGRIVVAGTSEAFSFVVHRLTRTGALDPSFSGTGVVETPIGATALASRVRVAPDGRIVVAGTATVGGRKVFAVVRYWP